jgi:uncharacterized membrane protein
MKKERKIQNILFGWLIAAAVLIILVVILEFIKITPLETYVDPQYHFSLKYPAYWKKIDRPEQGMALVQFVAPQSSSLDKFAENVNISLVDLGRKPGMTLQSFSHLTTKQLIGVFGDYVNILESREIRLGGLPAYRFSYMTHTDTFATKSKMKYFHVWTLRGGYALILTYVGEQKEFDKNLRHVNRMIRTFKFVE